MPLKVIDHPNWQRLLRKYSHLDFAQRSDNVIVGDGREKQWSDHRRLIPGTRFQFCPLARCSDPFTRCLLIVGAGRIITNQQRPLPKATSIVGQTSAHSHEVQINKDIIKVTWFSIQNVFRIVQMEGRSLVNPSHDFDVFRLAIRNGCLSRKGMVGCN